MSRPAGEQHRGLCRRCYKNVAIRAQHPLRTLKKGDRRHIGEGISDAEVLAMPPVLFGDGGPPPPAEYTPPAEGRKIGDLAAQWAGVGANGGYDLHPDTEPDAIRATHRAVVAEARERLGPTATAAEIGEDVTLPRWNVERVLAELEARDAAC